MNKTQTIKRDRYITLSNIKYSSTTCYPSTLNNTPCYFLGKLKYWLIYILDYLLFLTYKKKWTRTHISLLPICKLNYKILLPHHSLDKYHHFFPNPTAYSLPCVLIHQSKFFLHKVPQIYLWIVQLLLIYLIFDCDKRQSRGGIREGGGGG